MQYRNFADLGSLGETAAKDYLQRRGYRVVVTNFTAPVGRGRTGRLITGEIDIVAYDPGGVLCFVEVKTRSSRRIAPELNVDLRKRRKIVRVARVYRRVMGLGEEAFRFDVISVIALQNEDLQIEHLKDYFSERVFQASHWLKKC